MIIELRRENKRLKEENTKLYAKNLGFQRIIEAVDEREELMMQTGLWVEKINYEPDY